MEWQSPKGSDAEDWLVTHINLQVVLRHEAPVVTEGEESRS